MSAKYTTEVKTICESLNNYEIPEDDMYSNISGAAPQIFISYPIYLEAHRQELNEKILQHFYFREIGAETYAQWKFYLNRKLNEIMPYYNELFMSKDIFDGIDRDKLFNNIYYEEEANSEGTESSDLSSDFATNENITTTHEKVYSGKENTRTDFSGGETNTKSMTGKEKSTETISGTETDTKTISGSETDLETIGGSETKAKAGSDVKTNDAIDRKTKTYVSDTPQGTIANVDSATYLTQYQKQEIGGQVEDTTSYGSSETLSFANRQNQNVKSFSNRQDQNVKGYNNRQNETEKEFTNRQDTDTKMYNNRYDNSEKSYTNRKDNDTDNRDRELSTKASKTETASKIASVLRKVSGKNSGESYMDLIQKIREIIINIDMQIINELEPCFMQLW